MSSIPYWNHACIEPVSEGDRLAHTRFCSPYVGGLIDRHPEWLEQLGASGRLDRASSPNPNRAQEWISVYGLDDGLRAFRNQEMLRIIWRDLNGLAPLGEIFSELTMLAQVCLQQAVDIHHGKLQERFGQPRDKDGRPQKVTVIGVGKLGGGELNLSSDIDLIFCFPATGQCDGPRTRSNDEFFSKLSREVISTLGTVRPTGFCFRVDTRLRPFGQVGAIACSFAAMEQYYQREGRDWERYALIKARPVAGDTEAGEGLLRLLQPFIYRRYIDFGAIEALREMQSLIRAETARKERSDDIKRGPGGIREIEFLAQGFQLLRGGRDKRLQSPSLAVALAAIANLELLPADVVDRLRKHYTSLRHIENRLQAIGDQQTHRIPAGEDLQRLRQGLGIEGDAQFFERLERIRDEVAQVFDQTWSESTPRLSTAGTQAGDYDHWHQLWTRWRTTGYLGDEYKNLETPVTSFLAGLARRPIGQSASRRLDRFMPMLLQRLSKHNLSTGLVNRLLDLVLVITQRSAYLSLLTENPLALDRAIDLFSRSRWVAKRVVRFPELLDELIDPALGQYISDRDTMRDAAFRQLEADDEEAALVGLNNLKQANSLRLAVAWLEGIIDESAVHRSLSDLAEVMVEAIMQLAYRELNRRHGVIRNSALAIIGYGSLGARELSFDSDLDLVFLYDPGDGTSQGERPLEAERWFARLAQRMVGLLTAFTPSGKLYEIDTRLRPNGQSGLLVSSIAAFANYQREDAWTWEAQALTRARAVTGDPDLIAQFEEIRRENLCRARDPAALGRDLLEMRARVRDNQPDGFDSGVDIKHAPGGLVDIGFTAQLGVLSLASRSDVLFRERGVSEQLRNLRAVDWLDDEQFDLLQSRLNMLRKLRIEQELVATEARAALEDDCGRGEAVADLFTRLARG